jgi:hypothetical protein
MLADFFTKPLQGKFREVIMGHKHIDTLKELSPAPSQERVGKDSRLENIWNSANVQKTDALLWHLKGVSHAPTSFHTHNRA